MSKQDYREIFPHLELEDIKEAIRLLFKVSQATHDRRKNQEPDTEGLEEIINAANDNMINLLVTLSIIVGKVNNTMCKKVIEAVLETDCIGKESRDFLSQTLDGGDDE